MSLSNEINAVMDRMDVTTARDCVLGLRRKYSDYLTFIAEPRSTAPGLVDLEIA